MAWEHSLLGDLDPELVQAAASGDSRPVEEYRGLLGELGRAPRHVEEAGLRGSHPGLETVRLPRSGLVVTVGELVLARNASHFAPFSWYRWHSFHLTARALIARSAAADGEEREALRRRARVCAGYADHFLQDSFAAGHLVNKTLVIQWYIEWLAAAGVSYPYRDVLDALTVARQPLLHGPGHYDRAAARLADEAGGRGRRGAWAAVGSAGRGRRADPGGADRGERRHRRHRRRAARRVRGLPGDARQRHRAAGREGRARVPQQALARRLGRTRRPALPAVRRPHPAREPARERCARRRRPPRPGRRSRTCCGTARPRSTAGTSSTASPTTSSRTAGWSRFRNGTAAGCATCASNCSASGRPVRCGSSCPAPSGSWAGRSTAVHASHRGQARTRNSQALITPPTRLTTAAGISQYRPPPAVTRNVTPATPKSTCVIAFGDARSI